MLRAITGRIAATAILATMAGTSIQPAIATNQPAPQTRSTQAQAEAFLASAIEHIKQVGTEQALEDFTKRPEWKRGDLYLFAYRFDGTNIAHGKDASLVGENLIALRDQSGKPVIRSMVQLATTNNAATYSYAWMNPTTKATEEKVAIIRRIPGLNAFIGTGIYKSQV